MATRSVLIFIFKCSFSLHYSANMAVKEIFLTQSHWVYKKRYFQARWKSCKKLILKIIFIGKWWIWGSNFYSWRQEVFDLLPFSYELFQNSAFLFSKKAKIVAPFLYRNTVAKFIVPYWDIKLCSLCSLTGRYDIPMPWLTLSPQSGTWIGPLLM